MLSDYSGYTIDEVKKIIRKAKRQLAENLDYYEDIKLMEKELTEIEEKINKASKGTDMIKAKKLLNDAKIALKGNKLDAAKELITKCKHETAEADKVNLKIRKQFKLLRTKIQEKENISTLGRFYSYSYPEYGSPHSSSDGIYTEGLAYAYEIAKLINDSNYQNKFKTGIILGVYNLINLQYNNSNDKTNGAIRYSNDDYRIRIDSTQHAVDSFRKINDIFNGEWEYVYDSISGKLFDFGKDEEEIPRDLVWYTLGIGTVLSIILLFVIYLFVRKKYST